MENTIGKKQQNFMSNKSNKTMEEGGKKILVFVSNKFFYANGRQSLWNVRRCPFG
jgi:hypothetical protein